MAKIKVNENIYEGKKIHHTQYIYFCPACKHTHAFALKKDGGHHEFNMDLDNPTVTPSLNQNFTVGNKCHSYIKNGMIEFIYDCDHVMAGQTVPLPEITEEL